MGVLIFIGLNPERHLNRIIDWILLKLVDKYAATVLKSLQNWILIKNTSRALDWTLGMIGHLFIIAEMMKP
jgi:hypothetical protein